MSSSADIASPPLAERRLESLVIKPRPGWRPIEIGELWRYRELLITLAARDIRVRYKQTVLGAAWAVIQPLAQMIVFTAVFAAHGFSTEGTPAPVFYFAGLLPWQLFATSVAAAGNSLVGNRGLITKVYFPRLLIPLSAIVSGLVDFTISLLVLFGLMLWYHVTPSANVVFLPFLLLATTAAALAVGVWLSALNVEFRDVQYVIPFLVQFWLFVTPVIYPVSSIHGIKRTLIELNPVSGVVEGMRWCLLGRPSLGSTLVLSLVSIAFLLVTGLFFFRRMERSFADQL